VARKMLERLGFDVVEARDGREALIVYRDHANEIVCVLLDLTMPNMDGEEAFLALRQIRSDVNVIISSGYSEQEMIRRFSNGEPPGFIQKPYQMARLMTVLRNAVIV